MTQQDRKWWILIALGLALAVLFFVRIAGGDAKDPPVRYLESKEMIQGKSIEWWYRRTQQARKDANARRATVLKQRREIKKLRKTLAHDPSVQEAVALAAMVYPNFSQARAWRIIKHESWMTADPLHAYNRTSVNGCHATGLYQFLDCTFRSTPFGRAGFSIYSPYAQSLAAGWMHANGRGCEWDIDC